MEAGHPPDLTDTAALENAAKLALTAFCWWRPDLPPEICEAYWRDVHGIMFARAPGMWQCRQLRLAPNRADLWGPAPGVSFEASQAAQPQGLPHGLFLSDADLAAFADHPLPKAGIPNDARNFIGRIGALLFPAGRTFVDHINEPAPQGPPPFPTFVIALGPRDGAAPAEAFHRHLLERLGPAWSRHPGVLRLRAEPLPPYEEAAMASPGVPYQWPGDETYLGWIELAVRREDVLRDLLDPAFANDIAEQVRAIHTYPVREIYTLISAGRPTEVGLRGFPAVQTIHAAGADNQQSEAVLKLLFGEAVSGLDQLRSREGSFVNSGHRRQGASHPMLPPYSA